MKNIILNEKYNSTKVFFEKAKGDRIFYKNKSYIDLSFCSGAIFLGHNHSLFKKSASEYLKNNFSIFSNPNTQAVKLSKNIKFFFPNFHKIVFCNTGSESVIKALRISRAISKKKKVVLVTGSWHGSTDNTLFYPRKNLMPESLSAGIKESDKKNTIFIPYNEIKISKKILDKKKNNINCVIIEPIMGCLPNNYSKPYLKFLEQYCKKNKITLIFDEIITGFRSEKGSVQKKYNIKPDITLIGKILGGGLPIGAIGINKDIYSKIEKNKKKIFFGGTFSGNTFSTYMGNKVLSYIKKNKILVKKIIKNSEYFQNKINYYISKENLNAHVYRFDSILRIVFSKGKINNRIQRDFLEKKQIMSKIKFENYLFKRNIYFPPNGIILFSSMTNKKSIDYMINVINLGLKKYFKFK